MSAVISIFVNALNRTYEVLKAEATTRFDPACGALNRTYEVLKGSEGVGSLRHGRTLNRTYEVLKDDGSYPSLSGWLDSESHL